MKRFTNLYREICSIENLQAADVIARKGKSKQYGVIHHDRSRESNILALHEALMNKTYRTSQYSTFKVYEPKERVVFRLPYYPDRIVHHAIMLHMEKIFVACFTADTYSCIKGKGIHAGSTYIKKALTDEPATRYCLKLDITKFYPSVDHDILKSLLRRKIKDHDLLWLLDEIIDSAPGLPIGNYLSQYLANFYLTYFDHWIKEVKGIRCYIRYADDMAFFAATKEELHALLHDIKKYLREFLRLEVKGNHRVSPITDEICLDMLGYQHFRRYTLVRKSIKQNIARSAAKGMSVATRASYYGWLKWCDSINLTKKLLAA